MANKNYVLTAQLQIQGVSFSSSVTKEISKGLNVKVTNVSFTKSSIVALGQQLSKSLTATITNISISRSSAANLRKEIRNIVSGGGKYVIDVIAKGNKQPNSTSKVIDTLQKSVVQNTNAVKELTQVTRQSFRSPKGQYESRKQSLAREQILSQSRNPFTGRTESPQQARNRAFSPNAIGPSSVFGKGFRMSPTTANFLSDQADAYIEKLLTSRAQKLKNRGVLVGGPSVGTDNTDKIIADFRRQQALNRGANARRILDAPRLETGLRRFTNNSAVGTSDQATIRLLKVIDSARRLPNNRRISLNNDVLNGLNTGLVLNRQTQLNNPILQKRLQSVIGGTLRPQGNFGGGGGPPGGGGGPPGPSGPFPGVPFRPRTFATLGIKEATDDLRVFGRQAGNTLRRFIAYNAVSSIFISISNSLDRAVASFVEFDRELVRIAQVTRGTNSEIASVESTVRGLASNLGVSSVELLKSAETLAQAGVSVTDLPTILNAIAKSDLAPTFGSISETTEGLIAIMSQFNLEAKDVESTLGSINVVAAKFAVESEDILTAVRRAGGAFAAASEDGEKSLKTFQQFIATFTAIRSVTRESAESIATGLRTITTRLQRPSTLEFLEQRGVKLRDENDFIGLFKALKILNEEFTKLQKTASTTETFGILEEIGGFRQVSKLLPLLENFGIVQDSFSTALLGINSLSLDAIKAQDALSVQLNKTKESFNNLIAEFLKSEGLKNLIKTTLEATNLFIRLGSVISNLAVPLGLIGTALAARPLGRIAGGVLEGIGGQADAFGRTIRRGRGQPFDFNRVLNGGDAASAFLFSKNSTQLSRTLGGNVGRIASGIVDVNAPKAVQVFQTNLTAASRAFIKLQEAQLAYDAAVRRGASNQAELRFAVEQAAQSVANFSIILDKSQQRAIAAQGGNTFFGRTRRGIGRFFSRNRNALIGGGVVAAGLASQLLPEDSLGPITTTRGRAFGLGQGIVGGAATGAIIGSILPGFGTAIGGVTGALIGLVATFRSQNKELEQIQFQENATKFAKTFNELDNQLSKLTNPADRRNLLINRFGSSANIINSNFPIISADNRATNIDQLNTLLQRTIQSASPEVLRALSTPGLASSTKEFRTGSEQTKRDIQAVDNLILVLRKVGVSADATAEQIFEFASELDNSKIELAQLQLVQTETNNIVSKFVPALENIGTALENLASRTVLANSVLDSFANRINVGNIGQISAGSSNSLTRQLASNTFNRGPGFDQFLNTIENFTGSKEQTDFVKTIDDGQKQLLNIFNELIQTNFKEVNDSIAQRGVGVSKEKIQDASIDAETQNVIIKKLNGSFLLPIVRDSLDNIIKSGQTIQDALVAANSSGELKQLVRNTFKAQSDLANDRLRESVETAEKFFNQIRQQETQAFQSDIGAFRANLQAQQLGQAAIRTRAGEAGLSQAQEVELFRQRQSALTGGNFSLSDLRNGALQAANQIEVIQDRLDQLALGGDENKIRESQRALNAAQLELENFTKALEAYGDVQEQSAAITRELNNLEKQKQGLLGVAERLLTGDPREVARLQSGFKLATQVTNNGGLGNLQGISRDNLKSLFDALDLVGNLEFAGRGISGKELKDRILLNSFPGNVAQGFRDQQQNLLGQQAGLQDQAQLAFIELARVNTALAEQTRQQSLEQSRQFFDALKLGINAQQVIVNGPVTNGNGFATGGFVSGRSGRDKIPAMLSNGEFVMNRNAVQNFGPLLEQMNSGRFGKFAGGGIIKNIFNSLKRVPQEFNKANDLNKLSAEIDNSQRELAKTLNNADKQVGTSIKNAKFGAGILNKGGDQGLFGLSNNPELEYQLIQLKTAMVGIREHQKFLKQSFDFEIKRSKDNARSANFLAKNGFTPGKSVGFNSGKAPTAAGGFLPIVNFAQRGNFNAKAPISSVAPTSPTPAFPAPTIGGGSNAGFSSFLLSLEDNPKSGLFDSGSSIFTGAPLDQSSRRFFKLRQQRENRIPLASQKEINDFLNKNNPNVARRKDLQNAFKTDRARRAALNNEGRSDRLLLDLSRRGVPIDETAVNNARSGKSIAEILSDLARRGAAGQIGTSAIQNGAITTDKVSDQLSKVATQLSDAASKIPNQIDIKVGDVNVNVTGLDPLKIFNDQFLDAMATDVADRIRAQGQKQFGRKPN